MKRTILLAATAAGMVLSATTAQAEKWDMPMAYAATNFHSEMGVVFADKVRDYTGGKIDITVHAGGSLFKGGEIKRAVQTGQAPKSENLKWNKCEETGEHLPATVYYKCEHCEKPIYEKKHKTQMMENGDWFASVVGLH